MVECALVEAPVTGRWAKGRVGTDTPSRRIRARREEFGVGGLIPSDIVAALVFLI